MLYFGVGDYVHIRLLHGRPLNTHYNARKKTEKEKWKETKEKSEVHIFSAQSVAKIS